MDQVLDYLRRGRVFSLFDLVSSLHRITARTDTVLLIAYSTPPCLYEWLAMSQGSDASCGWYMCVTNEGIKGFDQIAVHLDDMIVFDSDP